MVHVFVSGRENECAFGPPPLESGGDGLVCGADDDDVKKFGHDTGQVAIQSLVSQKGISHARKSVASISSGTDSVDARINTQSAPWSLRGEWFRRDHTDVVTAAGGWTSFLVLHLPPGGWYVEVQPDNE